MNIKRVAQTLLGTVQAWVEPAFKAVQDRIDALEQRLNTLPAPTPGAKGDKGDDADPEFIRQAIKSELAEWPRPKDGDPGKDVDPAIVDQLVQQRVDEAVARIPKPKDGKDGAPLHPDTVARMVNEEVRRQVDAIPRPQDGKDAKLDLEWLERLITLQVQTRIDALPKAKDGDPGKDADMDALRAYARECAEAAVASIPPPKDGDPGKDADTDLIRAQLRNELADELAAAVKQIPQPAPGKDATDEQVSRVAEPVIARLVAAIPKPRDGEDGKPGTDGKDADHDAIVTAVLAKITPPKDGEDGKDADPAIAEAAAEQAVARLFADMADELMRGLEDETSTLPSMPSINFHVGTGIDERKRSQARLAMNSDRPSIVDEIAKKLEAKIMLPVRPKYDEKGRLLYAERFDPETESAD